MEERIAFLESALQKERERYSQLEEETDILASENHRLLEILDIHGIDRISGNIKGSSVTVSSKSVPFVIADGDGLFPSSKGRYVEKAGEMNSLCVGYISSTLIVCGGVDKILRFYDLEAGSLIHTHPVSAPILALDYSNNLLSCALMDGGTLVLQVSNLPDLITQEFRHHVKYVVSTGWSPDGALLFTCSQDKSIALYHRSSAPRSASADEVCLMDLLTQLRFPETPECAIFASSSTLSVTLSDTSPPPSSPPALPPTSISDADAPFLIIGLRGLPHLLYVNTQTLSIHRVSLNEHDWDSHVSFTPLALALSPCQRFLAVATDKDMHIVFECGTNKRVRILAGGHTCDAYGKPKIAWDSSGSYLFSNSQADNDIHVYALSSGRAVEQGGGGGASRGGRLRGHSGPVRDMKICPFSRTLLSTSFDRSVIEWV